MTDSSKIATLLLQAKPWASNSNASWLCSTLTLVRNLQKFHFPSRMDLESGNQILGLISKELQAYTDLQQPELVKAQDCSARDKELLFENFLATHAFIHSQGGEAFVLDKTGRFLALINMEDHLELTQRDCGEDLEQTFESLVKLEIALGGALNYAYSPRFGFLTSNPAHSGTALIVRVFIQIPAIVHLGLLDQVIEKYKSDAIDVAGLSGPLTAELVGDVLVASNAYSLGHKEEKILSEIRTFTTQLTVEEKGLRTRLAHEGNTSIKDKVGRAFGLVKFSFHLDTFEALDALSLLKLGVDTGWVTGTDRAQLNELFFTCRRANLLAQVAEDIPQEELAHRRSQYLRQNLENLQLNL